MSEIVIVYEQVGECWNATNRLDSDGYPVVQIDKRTTQAHRAVYEQFVAAIPAGKRVKRSCRNALCIRPTHLYIRPEAARKPVSEDRRYGLNKFCKRGHELTEDNVYRLNTGGRYCRQCVLTRARNNRRKNAKIELNE